jgi:hypothetical protein
MLTLLREALLFAVMVIRDTKTDKEQVRRINPPSIELEGPHSVCGFKNANKIAIIFTYLNCGEQIGGTIFVT